MDFSLPEEPAADDDFPFSVDSGDAEPATDDTGFDIDDEMPTMSDFKIDDDFAGSDDLSVDTAAASDEAPSFSLPVDDDFSASDFSLPETDDIEESSFDVDFSTDDMDASAGNDEDPFSFNDIPDFGDIPESNNDQNLLDSLDPGNPLAASFGADDSFFEEEERRSQRRVRIPVIICIVCAVISVIVLGIILFLTPSRLKKTECVPETEPVIEVPVTPVEDLTKARENEVVVSPIPVVPEPPKKVVQEPDPTPVQPVESAATAAPKKEPPVTQAPAKKEPQSVRYKLKWGDTLWDLADAYYRNPWQYKKIARWNGIKNPDYIIAGTYIYIPE
ncbi:MAG: LysM peptidoglycan-binding domain-containing protein [Treponemataceae bacterium]|nr:LysM peptidoglycan-binding domain-containing protein [Treponemataceae bacterium]